MNDHPDNLFPEPTPQNPGPFGAVDPHTLCEAMLLRAGADDELCPVGRERLAALIAADTEAEHRVAFERALRGACGKAMGGVAPVRCPEALRQRIQAIAAAVHAEESGAASLSPSGPVGAVERAAPVTRQRSFWSGSRGVAAAAAALLLTVSGLLVWQSSGLTGAGGRLTAVTYKQQVAEFVTKEHARIESNSEAAAAKFVHTDPTETQAWFKGLLGSGVRLIGLDQPIETIRFRGAGKCGVPGAAYGKSAHMQIEVQNAKGEPVIVSIFVAPANPALEIQKDVTYAIDMTSCGIVGYSVLAWTDGSVNYFLVADDGTDGCSAAIKAAGLHEPESEI